MTTTGGRLGSVKFTLRLIGYNLGVVIFALLLLAVIGGGVGPVELAIGLVLVVAGCVGVTFSALRSR